MAGKKITELNSGSLSNLPLSGVTAVVYSGLTLQHTLSDLRLKLVDSGSHVFTGSQVINGNLTVSGSITAQQYILSSSITNITTETISGSSNFGNSSDDKHTFTGSVNITGSLTSNNIIVGPISEILSGSQYTAAHIATSNSINIVHFEGNDPYYSQVNITNTNSGNNASSDLVLTADNGTENVHFVNLGINSSTYTGGLVGRENDAYLLNVGKDFYIGTVGGVNHPAKLYLFAEDNWENPQITIHTGSQVTFNTSSFTSGFTYEFNGNVKLQDELKVDGSITSSYFIGDGSQLTNLPVQTTNVSMFLSSSTYNSFTSSYNNTSSSFDSRIIAATNEQNLSHLATTGSNTFVGNQTLTGSLNVSGSTTITGSNGGLIYRGTTLETYPTLAEVHTHDDNPWLERFYNDTFSTSSAVMAYFGWNDGRFVFHNESTQSIGLQVNGFGGENGLLVYSDKVAFVNNVEVSGSLNVSGSTSISGGLAITNNGYSWSFNSDGKTRIPNITFNSDRGNGMVGIKPAIGREFQIETSTSESSVGPWSFGVDGTLTAPAGANIMRVSNLATTGSNIFVGDQTINGSLIIEGVSEILTVDGGFNGNRTFDYTSGSIFYLTGLTGNGVWNIENVPTTNNRAIALTYIINQGVSPYSGSQYQINGSNVTVKWVDSTIPTGSANKTEIIGLTAFRVSSTWDVIGSLSTFGI